MKFSNLSFENVEGYQQKCLLRSKSHFFNKQAIQQQSHQRKKLSKVIEVQKICFWETPQASFHELNAVHGELKVKALNGRFYHSNALMHRAVLLYACFSTSCSTAERWAQNRLTSNSKDKHMCQALCSLSSTQFN